MEITFNALKVFVAVEESGSVIAAARQLGSSASSVSQQLSNLETAIGAKLFDRRSRPLMLTPTGQILSRHAYRLLENLSLAKSELAELDISSLPELHLAIIDDLDATLTPTLVANLQQKYTNCFVHAFSGRSDWVTDRLEEREADIAVSSIVPRDTKGYRALGLLKESFILVAAKGAVGNSENVREQLAVMPFVQYSQSTPIGRFISQHLKRVRFLTHQRYAFEASRSILSMVVQERGWALTTPLNLMDADRFIDDVDILKMPFPHSSRTIYLICRNNELGLLPDELATSCRKLVAEDLITRFRKIAPHLPESIAVVEE